MRYLAPEKVNLGDTLPVAAVDARSVVPVSDEIGGVVIYIGGRPAYYVLNGEWFAAVPESVRAGHATPCPNEVVGQFESSPTMSSMSHSFSVTPAA